MRFNGHLAKLIPFEESRQNDFSNMLEDSQGRLWGMNFANQVFYLEKDTLRLLAMPAALRLNHQILKYLIHQEAIWLFTDKQMVVMPLGTPKRFRSYDLGEQELIYDAVLDLFLE